MTAAELVFAAPSMFSSKPCAKTVLVGRKSNLLCEATLRLLPLGCPATLWTALVESVGDAGDDGKGASTIFMPANGEAGTICAAVLPEACSRHASPVRPHAVAALVGGAVGGAGASVVCVLDDLAHAPGTACALGRAFPLFAAKGQRKGGSAPAPSPPPVVHIGFATAAGPHPADGGFPAYKTCAAMAMGVRRAARLQLVEKWRRNDYTAKEK